MLLHGFGLVVPSLLSHLVVGFYFVTALKFMARVFLLFPPHVSLDFSLLLVGGGFLVAMWLVCGWSQTRETWNDGFFPGASSIVLFTP